MATKESTPVSLQSVLAANGRLIGGGMVLATPFGIQISSRVTSKIKDVTTAGKEAMRQHEKSRDKK